MPCNKKWNHKKYKTMLIHWIYLNFWAFRKRKDKQFEYFTSCSGKLMSNLLIQITNPFVVALKHTVSGYVCCSSDRKRAEKRLLYCMKYVTDSFFKASFTQQHISHLHRHAYTLNNSDPSDNIQLTQTIIKCWLTLASYSHDFIWQNGQSPT